MTPITNGGTDYGYKLCKCARCGVERECTPSQDFYTLGDDTTGPLHCFKCFWEIGFSRFLMENRASERAEEQAIKNRIKEMKK